MGDALRLTSSLQPPSDMSRTLVYKLLSQLSSLPCSSGASSVLSLVKTESDRLPLAVDVLLPVLQDQDTQLPERILATYVLQALYDSHDHLTPFHDHLLRAFESERATTVAYCAAGLRPENEQFVWVLWKILRGESEDLAPYSPNILSRATLPEHLRASHLVLPNVQSHGTRSNFSDPHSSISGISRFAHQSTPSVQTRTPYFESEASSASLSPIDSFTHYLAPTSSRAQLTSSFSPFESDADLTDPQSITVRGGAEDDPTGSSRGAFSDVIHHDWQTKHFEMPRRFDTHLTRDIGSNHINTSPSSIASKNHRREALLHALCQEPQQARTFQMRDQSDELIQFQNGITASSNRSQDKLDRVHGMRPVGTDVASQYDYKSQNPPAIPPQLSRVQRQSPITQNHEVHSLGSHPDVSPSSFTITASSDIMTRPQLGPIARPRPSPLLFYNSDSQVAAPDIIHTSAPDSQYNITEVYSQEARASMGNGFSRHAHVSMGSEFAGSVQTPSANRSLQLVQGPGVIGSGRPSSKSMSPVSSDAGERERRLSVGVIGNGRPARFSPGLRTDVVNESSEGMMPCLVERSEQRRDKKINFGAIGRPKTIGRDRDVIEWSPGGAPGDTKAAQTQEYPSSTPSGVSDVLPKRLPFPGTGWDPPSNGDQQDSSGSVLPSEEVHRQVLAESRVGNTTASAHSSPEHVANSQTASPSFQKHLPTTVSTSLPRTPESKWSAQQMEDPHTQPDFVTKTNVEPRAVFHEKERDELARAMVLLLSARERVLKLSEQRVLIPQLPLLAGPLSLLRPEDLHPLAANNPDVAAKMLVFILDRDDEDGARVEQLLRDVNRDDLSHLETTQASLGTTSRSSNRTVDVVLAAIESVNRINGMSSDSTRQDNVSPFGGGETKEGYLDKLRHLPPMMQSFNLIAKLLHPTLSVESSLSHHTPEIRVAKLIRAEVLGQFLSECVRWIEKAEDGERDGEVLDDRVAISVSNLSRFYSSLLKHGFFSAESEVDTTEIMSFALHFSRFDEARSLYSTLAAART